VSVNSDRIFNYWNLFTLPLRGWVKLYPPLFTYTSVNNCLLLNFCRSKCTETCSDWLLSRSLLYGKDRFRTGSLKWRILPQNCLKIQTFVEEINKSLINQACLVLTGKLLTLELCTDRGEVGQSSVGNNSPVRTTCSVNKYLL